MAKAEEQAPFGDKLERRQIGERRQIDDRRGAYERRASADRRNAPPESWNDALFSPDMGESEPVKARSFLDRRDGQEEGRRTGYSRRDGSNRRDE